MIVRKIKVKYVTKRGIANNKFVCLQDHQASITYLSLLKDLQRNNMSMQSFITTCFFQYCLLNIVPQPIRCLNF